MATSPLSTDQKMDPVLKAKWLEALRSGRYTQGQGALRSSNNCFCCLGVLADVMDPSGWGTAEHQVRSFDGAYYDYRKNVEMLGEELLDELRLKEKATVLACMNDGEDGPAQDFEAIAEWIERNL